jgi:dTDP-4-amino-4,6-dideoxygalactose transaminase
VLSYGRHSIDAADIEAVVSVLQGDWLTTGPAVDQFEAALTEWAGGTPCVSVTSGTAALHVAYAALGVGEGDHVVTSPMTFVATAATAYALGATVDFADVDYDSGLIDTEAIKPLIKANTKVISAVDYAGQPCDMDTIGAIAKSAGAFTLEDAAHSIGSLYKGQLVGSIADITTFSFYPTKNVTTGEGGAVAAKDPEIFYRARKYKMHGLVRDRDKMRYPDEGAWHQEVHEFGLNYRLPDILCALGTTQLARLEEFKEKRKVIVDRYNEAFANIEGLKLPTCDPENDPVWHLYPLRVLEGRRREVFDKLRAAGIGVQVNYIPAYWHPVLEDLGFKRGLCPNAEKLYSEEISMPIFVDLSTSQQDQVIDATIAALKS